MRKESNVFGGTTWIGLELLYMNGSLAESAWEDDLTVKNVKRQMRAAGFDAFVEQSQLFREVDYASGENLETSNPGFLAFIITFAVLFASPFIIAPIGCCCLMGYRRLYQDDWRKIVDAQAEEIKNNWVNSILPPVLQDVLRNTVYNSRPVGDSKFAHESKDLVMGQAKLAAEGLEEALCVTSKMQFYGQISKGVQGIEEEVKRFVRENEGSDAAVREVEEMFNYIVYEGSFPKEYPNGILDEGRPEGTRLSYFVTHPKAVKAKLSDAHVVALRMYTTFIYKYMNLPLRDQSRRRKKIECPLPVTTW